ncbi:hypothetical protein BpHYR1_005821 [Brachionus plicatilis]|uniref:Uncharacterized protein n=1 Tax=Brachionus plicatilis TaxID=10195 RepID=A0A3M7SMX0_BRAPC|nr:hypothetical protein BpHYR1_005821 [Brachionus plicatilis]
MFNIHSVIWCKNQSPYFSINILIWNGKIDIKPLEYYFSNLRKTAAFLVLFEFRRRISFFSIEILKNDIKYFIKELETEIVSIKSSILKFDYQN